MSRRCRITFVLPGRGLDGGIRVVVACGNRLVERGYDVSIVCLKNRWGRRPRAVLKRLRTDVPRALGLRRDHLDDFTGRLSFVDAKGFSRGVFDGDAVIATHWMTASLVADLPSSRGRKYYFIQGAEREFFGPADVDATWRLPMHKIVISRRLQEMARDRFDDPNATLMPNAVDHELFHAPVRQMHDPPTVGILYARYHHKGFDVASQVIREVRGRISDLRVVCYGAVKPSRLLPLPAGSEFYYRPAQKRLRAIYASCDVWLCTSRSEGFGLPPLEAMACRCPVVMTKVSGAAEYLEDGVNGYVTDVDAVSALADRVLRVLSSSRDWERMSDAAYETSKRFDWDRSVDVLEKLLTERPDA